MTSSLAKRKRAQRGNIERLPNGGLRVRVYAGIDPVSGKRHYLREIVPPGPKAETEAEKVKTRLLNQSTNVAIPGRTRRLTSS